MFDPRPLEHLQYAQTKFGQYFDWTQGGIPGSDFMAHDYAVSQEMPVNHTNPRNKKGNYVSGKDWLANHQTVQQSGSEQATFRPHWGKAFEGRYAVRSNAKTSTAMYTQGDLFSFQEGARQRGAEGWSRMKPAQPDFSLANSLYELREIPRQLKQATELVMQRVRREAWVRYGKTLPKRRKLRKGGSRYDRRGKDVLSHSGEWFLAIEFGWLPLYRDIIAFSDAFNTQEKTLKQLIRDEGRPVKRRRKLSSQSAEDETLYQYDTPWNGDMYPTHVTQCYAGGYHSFTKRTQTVEIKDEAVGTFRYFLPPGPRDSEWTAEMLRRIKGGRITPTVVYNAIPWTWLVDYFTDLGHFVAAVSPGVEDNLYADEAYIIRTVKRTTSVHAQQSIRPTLSGGLKRADSLRVTTDKVKIRVKASPFGFGLSDDDLSPKQTAILGALGLTRLP